MDKEKKVSMSINIPIGLLERVDNFARHRGINRTAAIMVLTSSSLDEFENGKVQSEKEVVQDGE